MESPIYNSLVFKVQSLEERLNQITKGTRDYHDASAIYLTKKPQHYGSIQNLIELAKKIKHELRYSLKCNPEDRKTLKMYNKICILESELYNLVNCIQPFQNTRKRRRVCVSRGSCRVLPDVGLPMKDSSDYSGDSPNRYYRRRLSFAPQELKTSSSDSFGESSYYLLSSESSSSTAGIDKNRKPLYVRRSSSSFQTQPSTLRTGRRTPERLPIYVEKSRSSYERKKDKSKRNTPKSKKKSSLRFGIHKSDSNKINVGANDLQTQETEVFLIKKKRKPSKPREQSGKSPNSGRYFISRLRRVMSNKSRDRSQKNRKSSTPEHREEKFSMKKHAKNRVGISKYKENDPNLEGSSPKYSEDRLYGGGKRRKKPSIKRFGSEESIEPRISHDSKPVDAVVRSSNLNHNPFYDQKHIFYLQDSNFILFPKKLSSKELNFPRNHGSGELNSKGNKETLNNSFIKSVRTSKSHKNNNIYNIDSNYEITTSYQNSDLYLKKNDISLSTRELNPSFERGSKFRSLSKNSENFRENSSDRRRNKYDSFNNKNYDEYNSNMTSKNNRKSNQKYILLKVVNDPIPLFENKGSITKNFNKSNNYTTLNARLTSNKTNSFHITPFGDSTTATAPSIYLASVPQTLAQNSEQNPPLLSNLTPHKVESYNYYIVNSASALENVQNKESPNSINISNLNYPPSPQSIPSEKTINFQNKKIHTLNKSGSKIFPFKTVSKNMNNSNTESRGPAAPFQNTKVLSREYSTTGVQPALRDQSPTDVSSVGSNQSSTSKKSKKWLPRSLSKISILSKRSKNAKGDKDSKRLNKEASKISLPHLSKHSSKDKQPSTDKVSKTKSWTSLKRTMSGVGSLMKPGKAKKAEKQEALKRVESEKKLKKQPSLLKRMFSKEKRSKLKTQMSNDAKISSTGHISRPTSGYEGEKTSSISILNHPPNTNTDERLKSDKLDGYQVGSKMGKNKDSNVKKDKQPVLTPSPAKSKKRTLKDDPNAFNYSMHYSKENHKCGEIDLGTSSLCLVNRKCCPRTGIKTCNSKILWSMGETILSEHELSEFEKHNKYCEFFFKPKKCQGCAVYDKKVSKVCRKRGDERKSLNSPPLNKISNHDNGHLHSDDHISYSKSIPVTTSDNFLSDSSDICDWKKIANEIKECH